MSIGKDSRSYEEQAMAAKANRDSMPDAIAPIQQLQFSNPGQLNSLTQAIQRIARQQNATPQVGPSYQSAEEISPYLLEMIRQYQMGRMQ